MNITFKSTITQAGQTQDIEFTSAVTLDEFEGFKVFEFKEPSQNIQNRIEVADDKVNIFAGPSTINLVLGKIVPMTYETPAGQFEVDTHLLELKNSDNPEFTYELSRNGEAIGKYEIKLTVK